MSHHTLRLELHLPIHIVCELQRQAYAENMNLESYIDMAICRLATHPTHIRFREVTMNPTAAGQTQVFTGTLTPTGSVFPADSTFSITSNDPSVSPSVDASGLVVSVTYPAGWVESTTTPLAFAYTATSASTGMSLTATITPSAPPAVVPTGIAFQQTT